MLGTLVANYSCNYHCRMCDLPLKEEEIKQGGIKELDTVDSTLLKSLK